MGKSSKVGTCLTMGLDLGDEYAQVCVVDDGGDKIDEGRVRMTQAGLKARFETQSPCRIAVEAGTHSAWVSRLLKEWGHEVLVANPRKLRLIYENNQKSDSADAEHLARVARLDPKLLSPIEHRSAKTQTHLAVLRSRDLLVRARTKLINHVRGMVKTVGHRLTKGISAEAFGSKAEADIPGELRPSLGPVLETIRTLTQQIRVYDRAINEAAQDVYPETKKLQQVAGVGPLTSLAFVLTVQDPHRFTNSRKVGAYFGLRPRQSQSGEQDPQLRITKSGDGFMRRLLVGSAQYILGPFGPDCDLKRFGDKLSNRGGKNAKKRAVVAVARKLSVLLHRLWVTGKPYEALRVRSKSSSPPTAAPGSLRSP